jgi:hypothetical protein
VDKRLTRPCQNLADRRDGECFLVDARLQVSEVGTEGERDYGVGGFCTRAESGQIGKIAAQWLGPRLCYGVGGGVRSSEADDLVAGREKVSGEGGPDVSTGSGNEDAHVCSLIRFRAGREPRETET